MFESYQFRRKRYDTTIVCEEVTDNSMTSILKLSNIKEIVVDVYNWISEVEETTNERGSNIISIVTVDGTANNKMFRNKTLNKRRISVYVIHDNFQFKESKLYKKKYV